MTAVRNAGVAGAVATAIIAGVFAVEGGYSDNPNDPGGKTNHGVTEAVARQHGYTGDMKALPKSTAFDIYHQDYIVKPGFAPFVEAAPAVGEELTDSGINAGPAKPARWLQTSLNAFSQRGKLYPQIEVDGQVGAATVAAYRGLQKVRGPVQACKLIVKALDAQQGAYYLSISQSNPKLQDFTTGWFEHRIGNVDLSKCAA